MAKLKRGMKTAAVRDYDSKHPGATAGEVAAALKEQGITISTAMVYNIRHNTKKPGRKPGRKARKNVAANNGASEHGGKSEAVRAAVRELGRKTPTKDVIDHLAAKGIPVSVALVAKVKSRMKPGRRGRRGRKAAVAAPAARSTRMGGQITYEHLVMAKELADKFGGADSLRKTLDLLEKLR